MTAAAASLPAAEGDRRQRARLVTIGSGIVLVATMLVSTVVGPAPLAISDVPGLFWRGIVDGPPSPITANHVILFNIRLPRTVLAVFVGAALAVAGALMQGLFRNPLADPGLVGVSAGAALGAVFAIVLGGLPLFSFITGLPLGPIPIAAFLGGLGSTMLLYRIATRRGQTSVSTMLLAGIALGALAGALTSLLVFMSDDDQLRDLTFWLLGGLGGATWTKIWVTTPLIVLALAVTPMLARSLDAMVLGEQQAHHLGVPVQLAKRAIVFVVALAMGAAVSVSGIIGFVGLIVPHLLRLVIGPEHRTLLPAAALVGAILVLSSDMVARTIVAPAELPIGILTAALGAPFFLFILLRSRSIVDL